MLYVSVCENKRKHQPCFTVHSLSLITPSIVTVHRMHELATNVAHTSQTIEHIIVPNLKTSVVI